MDKRGDLVCEGGGGSRGVGGKGCSGSRADRDRGLAREELLLGRANVTVYGRGDTAEGGDDEVTVRL